MVSPDTTEPYGILVTGVGGTGVVTIGALLGMAAHIEGKGCSVLDMAGLAQKGGAVVSHVRIGTQPEDIHAVRISAGGAKLVLGCDLVVAGSFDALSKIQQGTTHAVINAHETITSDFIHSDVKQQLHHAFRVLFRSKLSMRTALEQVAKNADHCQELEHLLTFIRQSKRGVARRSP